MNPSSNSDLATDLTAEFGEAVKSRIKGPSRDSRIAEFFGFESKTRVFTFSSTGKAIQTKLEWPSEPAITPVQAWGNRKPVSFALPLEVEGVVQSYPLNLGLVGISGGTEAGKSTFLRALARLTPIRRLLAVEPPDTPEELVDTPMFSSVDGALVEVVRNHYFVDSTVLHAIDSLRAPLFETSGPAGEKGIIMPFFTQVTRVSNALASAGITVLTTVNPMNDDPEFVKAFLKKLSASLPTTILLEGYVKKGREEVFTGTISSRPNRAKRRFTLVLGGSAPVVETQSSEIEFKSAAVELTSFATNALANSTQKVI